MIVLLKKIKDSGTEHLELIVPEPQELGKEFLEIKFCCEGVEDHYNDLIVLHGESLALKEIINDYGDTIESHYDIKFCPFCGEKFEYQVHKTMIRERKWSQEVINRLEVIDHEQVS